MDRRVEGVATPIGSGASEAGRVGAPVTVTVTAGLTAALLLFGLSCAGSLPARGRPPRTAAAAAAASASASSSEPRPADSNDGGKPRGPVQLGKATYYDPRLEGHLTANGERYNPEVLTAAHPTLPFGTRVRVTRLDAPKELGQPSVVVRINDRCAGRKKIIDLSSAAARRLHMMRAGRVDIRLEVLGRN